MVNIFNERFIQLRTNALIQIFISTTPALHLYGYGEIGLPPKKKNCYLADYSDILEYVKVFVGHIQTISKTNFVRKDPFEDIPLSYFSPCRESSEKVDETQEIIILRDILTLLDSCPANNQDYSRAAKCGIEIALFDLWGKLTKQPIYSLFGLFSPVSSNDDSSYKRKGFYTAAMNSDISKTISVIKSEAADSTNFLKIKINDDYLFVSNLLRALNNDIPPTPGLRDWVLDANAAWTPSIAASFIDILMPYKDRIYMLEQPFPVDFLKNTISTEYDKDYLQQWIDIKNLYFERLGILLFADESVSTHEDVLALEPYIHGCNIKLEKAGGFRGAVRAMHAAASLGCKVWSGCMVGSVLNSSAAAHLLSLVSPDAGVDLDGSLLVTAASSLFKDGIKFHQNSGPQFGYMEWSDETNNSFGIGCEALRSEPIIK